MTDVTDELSTLSNSVFESAREAAFALMQANYSERKAPEMGQGQKVRGLEAQAQDLAIRFRESIWYRFDALRFHHELLLKVHGGYVEALDSGAPLDTRLEVTDGYVAFVQGGMLDHLYGTIYFRDQPLPYGSPFLGRSIGQVERIEGPWYYFVTH